MKNNKIPQPEPLSDVPECPDWMPEHGKTQWDRLAPLLVEHKVLTDWDLEAFEMLCLSYHFIRESHLLMRDGWI